MWKWRISKGLNLIKLLHMQFTRVAIVLESENNSYTCKSFIKWTPGSKFFT